MVNTQHSLNFITVKDLKLHIINIFNTIDTLDNDKLDIFLDETLSYFNIDQYNSNPYLFKQLFNSLLDEISNGIYKHRYNSKLSEHTKHKLHELINNTLSNTKYSKDILNSIATYAEPFIDVGNMLSTITNAENAITIFNTYITHQKNVALYFFSGMLRNKNLNTTVQVALVNSMYEQKDFSLTNIKNLELLLTIHNRCKDYIYKTDDILTYRILAIRASLESKELNCTRTEYNKSLKLIKQMGTLKYGSKYEAWHNMSMALDLAKSVEYWQNCYVGKQIKENLIELPELSGVF